MSIFPALTPGAALTTKSLPLAREIGWDWKANKPRFRGGEPVMVTGLEAVAVWCYLALKTPRGRYLGFTHDYGDDVFRLIGSSWVRESKEGNAGRMVRECLMVNPYVTGVSDLQVSFSGDTLTGKATIDTIYGKRVIDFGVD